MAKQIIKKTISDAQLKNELIKLFEGGNTSKYGKSATFGIIRQKYTLARDRFKNMFDSTLNEWQEIKQNANNDTIYQNQSEALKSGLKSKLERQLEIQSYLDPNYRVEEIVGVDVKNGKVIRAMRPLTPTEIRNYHAELSKMGGEYSALKQETVVTVMPTTIEL